MKEIDRTKIRTRFVENKSIRVLLFTLILLSEVFALINQNFLSSYNLLSIGQSLAPYALLSMGALFPIALGYTDLSSGAVCIGAAVVAGKLYALGMPLFLVIPVMILFGLLAGLLNGMLVADLKLPPFIVTLGTMMFIRGITALFANQPNILFPTASWYNRVFSTVRGLPTGFFWVLLFGILTGWFFKKNRVGRHLLAVGSNEKAAVIAGLNTRRLKLLAFSASGMFAGIAAIFWSASFATVTVATGNGMELDAIAGAYIGGSAAAGGSVSTAGAVIGALLLVIIRSGLNFVLARLNISLNSTYVTYVITGIIVVAAVLLDKTKKSSVKKDKEIRSTNQLKIYALPAAAFLLAVIMLITNTSIFLRQKKSEENTLAVLMKSEGSDFWNSVTAGATDAADELGYRLLIRGCESEDSSQLPAQRDLLRVMLSENPAGVAVATIADGFTDLLEEAYDRSIPVIEYDSGLYAEDEQTLKASDKNPLCGFVQGDNYANAALAADETFKSVYDNIVMSDHYIAGVIQHENSNTAAERSNGFKDRFMELAEADPKTAGKVTVYVEVKPSDANNAYKEALEALYEKEASLIFMTALHVTNQVYDAVASSGSKYDGMFFSGYDSCEKALSWLESNSKAVFLGGISQNPYALGHLTVEALISLADGSEIPEVTVVPGVWYDLENYQELIEEQVLN